MSGLKAELVALIRDQGPLPVSRYMALCLGHPRHGYYMTRDPFGAAGDFTTAPEISQMFGELIGLWVANVWQAMGSPSRLRLVELGPGRGTLMADLLRAVRVVPGLREAVSVHLIETSLVLRAVQEKTLLGMAEPVWHETIAAALDGPVIVLANEFLDALPLDQFVMTPQGWRERLVGLDAAGELAFGLSGGEPAAPSPNQLGLARVGHLPVPKSATADFGAGEGWREGSHRAVSARMVNSDDDSGLRDPSSAPSGHLLPQGEKGCAPIGSVHEHPQAALGIVSAIAGHVTLHGGAALLIDYGSARSGFGDTLQAMKAHGFVPPLSDPGEADLTVHVDFARMARAGLSQGAAVHGPATQAAFLLALGLAARAQALFAKASQEQAAAIALAFDRLTQQGATGMGELFKVLALTHPDLAAPPGFDLHRLPEQV